MTFDISKHEDLQSFTNYITNEMLKLNKSIIDKSNPNYIQETNRLLDIVENFLCLSDKYKYENSSKSILCFLSELSNLGLPLYYVFDINKIEELLNIDVKDVYNGFLQTCIDNNFILLRNIVSQFISLKNDFKEFEYFDNALCCLYQNNYYSCVCSMFPLIENIIIKTSYYSKAKIRKDFIKAIDNYFNENNFLFYKEAWGNLKKIIVNMYTQYDRTKPIFEKYINRNAIEHGEFYKEINIEDCIQLIFLYINISEILSIMSIKHVRDKLFEIKDTNK